MVITRAASRAKASSFIDDESKPEFVDNLTEKEQWKKFLAEKSRREEDPPEPEDIGDSVSDDDEEISIRDIPFVPQSPVPSEAASESGSDDDIQPQLPPKRRKGMQRQTILSEPASSDEMASPGSDDDFQSHHPFKKRKAKQRQVIESEPASSNERATTGSDDDLQSHHPSKRRKGKQRQIIDSEPASHSDSSSTQKPVKSRGGSTIPDTHLTSSSQYSSDEDSGQLIPVSSRKRKRMQEAGNDDGARAAVRPKLPSTDIIPDSDY